jgi:cytochrome c
VARLGNAAAFIKANIPLGAGNSLSDGEAVDIAAYFISQPPAGLRGQGPGPAASRQAGRPPVLKIRGHRLRRPGR